jgi:beta-1,4-mannosyl-glycoprotein beta-1,4-N-acetylglucosaminyltransferase
MIPDQLSSLDKNAKLDYSKLLGNKEDHMLIDCFSFFNEYDILEGRLEYLYPTVDYFVIVESNRTHTGNLKPFNYMENITRYQKYSDKILYFPYISETIEFYKSQGSILGSEEIPEMLMDHAQRNHMAKALKLFGPEVFVMISDLDEIPSRRAINYAANHVRVNMPAIGFVQDMFYYNLKQKQVNPWVGTVITTNRVITEKSPQWVREQRWTLPNVANAGWHLSYWGDVDKIKNKIENFAHQEFNSELNRDPETIRQRIAQGLDIFGRDNQFVSVDINTLPQDLLSIFSKYERTY